VGDTEGKAECELWKYYDLGAGFCTSSGQARSGQRLWPANMTAGAPTSATRFEHDQAGHAAQKIDPVRKFTEWTDGHPGFERSPLVESEALWFLLYIVSVDAWQEAIRLFTRAEWVAHPRTA
jgi:hypothetical protein